MAKAKRKWEKPFLDQLAQTSNVTAAADKAKISVSHVYKTRRDDAEFARRWHAALAEGYDNLEMEMLQRLRDGRLEDTDEDGTKRKFDMNAAFRCLTAHRDTVSREKGRRTLDDEIATIKSINAKIDLIREREERAAKLEKAKQKQRGPRGKK